MYHNSCLFVFGGYTNESAPSDELWCFDLNLRQWSLKQLAYYAPNQPQAIAYAPYSRAHQPFAMHTPPPSQCGLLAAGLTDRLRPRYFHATFTFSSSMYIFGGKVDGKPSVRARTKGRSVSYSAERDLVDRPPHEQSLVPARHQLERCTCSPVGVAH